MKIVVQNFKTGELSVTDAPKPSLSPGSVLLRTHASLISAGTDRAIIELGKKGYLGKALDRPDLAKKVINRARTEGVWSTYQVVKNLIAEPIPLGYSLIGKVKGSRAAIGILLDYDHQNPLQEVTAAPAIKRPLGEGRIGLGLIGAGQFGKGILLPAMLETNAFALCGVASAKGMSAKIVAERYGAGYGVAEADRVLDDPEVAAVLITTRHDSHARYVIEALERRKHVFVEKPLALAEADLAAIEAASKASAGTLTVGFNRRFSP